MKDAPWIGKCREESFSRYEREFVGYCEECEEPLYEDDEYNRIDGTLYCEKCYEKIKEDEDA